MLDQLLLYGFMLALLHRVKGDSPHWVEYSCAMKY